MNLAEIVDRVKSGCCGGFDCLSACRPDLSVVKCEESVTRCIQDCWHDDPDVRPDFKYCRVRLKSLQKGLYVDSLLSLRLNLFHDSDSTATTQVRHAHQLFIRGLHCTGKFHKTVSILRKVAHTPYCLSLSQWLVWL